MDTVAMYTIKRLPEFDDWLAGISDLRTRQRLVARLRKVQLGALGDVKALGAGVHELREHFGPGWRMYHLKHGHNLIVMLGGGGKSTQAADIAHAKRLARTIEF